MNSQSTYSAIGSISSLYDFLTRLTGYKKSVEYFVSQIPFPADTSLKVLDAGCGTGIYSFAILDKYKNAQVTAFDLDSKLVDFVQKVAVKSGKEARVRTFVADITSALPQIGEEKFDLIITSGVLVYVPHEATVRNLSRFLKPQGYFFNSPNRDSAWGRFVCFLYSCKPYPKEENISVFEKNGFVFEKNIKVPKTLAASFKDAHLFKKI